jgi:hypothetical protein
MTSREVARRSATASRVSGAANMKGLAAEWSPLSIE